MRDRFKAARLTKSRKLDFHTTAAPRRWLWELFLVPAHISIARRRAKHHCGTTASPVRTLPRARLCEPSLVRDRFKTARGRPKVKSQKRDCLRAKNHSGTMASPVRTLPLASI
jgi:hypothetical protein